MSETSSATPDRARDAAPFRRRVMAGDALHHRVVDAVDDELVVGGQRPPDGRLLEDYVRILAEAGAPAPIEAGKSQGQESEHPPCASQSLRFKLYVGWRGIGMSRRDFPAAANPGKCVPPGLPRGAATGLITEWTRWQAFCLSANPVAVHRRSLPFQRAHMPCAPFFRIALAAGPPSARPGRRSPSRRSASTTGPNSRRLDRGGGRAASAAAERQRGEIARLTGYYRSIGCERGPVRRSCRGPPPAECGSIAQRIRQLEANYAQPRRPGSTTGDSRRRQLIAAVQQTCGAGQPAQQQAFGGPRGFFESLFGPPRERAVPPQTVPEGHARRHPAEAGRRAAGSASAPSAAAGSPACAPATASSSRSPTRPAAARTPTRCARPSARAPRPRPSRCRAATTPSAGRSR